MTLQEGLKLYNETENALLLDVRSQEEYAGGHLDGSVNVPINRLALFKEDKERPIFIYCLSGARAGRAEKFLKSLGYNATNIGGISGYEGNLVF